MTKKSLLELIFIGPRKRTNDGKSDYRTIRLVDLLTGDTFIIRPRDDRSAGKITYLVGQIWMGLELLQPLVEKKLLEPDAALNTDFLTKENIVRQPGETYMLIQSSQDRSMFVYKNGAELLLLNKRGALHYYVTRIENQIIQDLESLSKQEIVQKYCINIKNLT